MKKLRLLLLLSVVFLLLIPVDVTYAKKGTQVRVPDTIADSHSKYTAKYKSGIYHTCTAILISSTAAVTAKHCGGNRRLRYGGTIYPGASGYSTPFGYMNISDYIPNPKYDIAVIKGTLRDQDKFYRYYIRPFKTKVTGYTSEQLQRFVGKEGYSYGYPNRDSIYYQYRSDGNITFSQKTPLYLRTELPAYGGQSGSGVFTKDSDFIGIIITRTPTDFKANVLPFTTDIANWINKYAN
ncbi:trypsin-like serine protease [Staphylococcus ursi]|uniref:trypsin-like serine peptidase n=1 Tax=Staphylococcus sp. MI 10-1553 TaxID=1912064 RepID=UPI001396DF28|nr:trypsin-like serine protease [Staphylococcus sp. MI 10-1553]QHW37988.1 trypsin-like serine protease [Staphylococcus sp. MI 10-1553]